MSKIPTNPVKALHVSDFEDMYWAEIKRLKQRGARRALYAAPVLYACFAFVCFFCSSYFSFL